MGSDVVGAQEELPSWWLQDRTVAWTGGVRCFVRRGPDRWFAPMRPDGAEFTDRYLLKRVVTRLVSADGCAVWPANDALTAEVARLREENATLRQQVEAVRGLVADWKHAVIDDCWYTCPQATEERENGECCNDNTRGGPCDCGTDSRRNAILAVLDTGQGGTDGSRQG